MTKIQFCFSLLFHQIRDNTFEEVGEPLRPIQLNNTQLCRELAQKYSRERDPDIRELARILSKAHVKALIETHDEVGERALHHTASIPPTSVLPKEFIDITDSEMPGAETIRMVGLRRNPNEPLGLTVEVDEHSQLVVARILAGGMIDRQALLNPGDVILEVNGVPVATPEQLQDQILLAKESVTLKIGPSVEEEMKSARLIMSGGQVKNGRNLNSGKKLTVSNLSLSFFRFVFILYSKFNFKLFLSCTKRQFFLVEKIAYDFVNIFHFEHTFLLLAV